LPELRTLAEVCDRHRAGNGLWNARHIRNIRKEFVRKRLAVSLVPPLGKLGFQPRHIHRRGAIVSTAFARDTVLERVFELVRGIECVGALLDQSSEEIRASAGGLSLFEADHVGWAHGSAAFMRSNADAGSVAAFDCALKTH